MSNRKKIRSNRRDKSRPKSHTQLKRVVLTEENKRTVGAVLGYPIETLDQILAEAKAEGYKGVSIPLPPGK